MKIRFKKSKLKMKSTVSTKERWELEIDGWDVCLTREMPDDGDGRWDLSVSSSFDLKKRYYERNRCSIYSLRPRNVDELADFANAIGPVLLQTVAALRREGISDMRSKEERRSEQQYRESDLR